MKTLKNIGVGFLVSFLGSIPLGFLNVVGYQIYQHSGTASVIPFLLGVISVEVFVIYFTLIFADRLMKNKKLLRIIEGFSVIFMFVLAYIFYSGAKHPKTQQSILQHYIDYSPFVIGIILNAINFVQLPFWTGWNLYLLNGGYIDMTKNRKYYYVIGTLLGTFIGMLAIILSLHFLTSQTDFLTKYLMLYIIPAVFTGLGIFQAIQFYRKHRHNK